MGLGRAGCIDMAFYPRGVGMLLGALFFGDIRTVGVGLCTWCLITHMVV